ncbi:Putative Ubiquitin-conjugating enzyme [[Torrubiella] hemipterigena]|uniref:Putative Ubiquitin-conjugating enzyme n=1 Tax=[Torrubiella] hemipterigena TaxID=1531966 RepID=A0A0A1TBT8_9HYPO|nr:Putative Ubiquitin-conjugating enzyme [[Torrubiella] hemipterigena]
MPTSPSVNRKSPTIRRILREAAELSGSISPDYTAVPLEEDLFEWHFTLRGPPNSAYGEGIYHGKIILPPTYPLRPPTFKFMTPSGRFEVNSEICLSISGHHEETWQPAWGIRTALVALRTFMETNANGQVGGLETTNSARQQFALKSAKWTCTVCSKSNADIIKECEELYAATSESSGTTIDDTVPEELRMVMKDDLKESAATSAPSFESNSQSSTSREVIEPDTEADIVQPSMPRQRPRTAVVAPNTSAPRASPTPLVAPQNNATSPPIPIWIDRAIVILAIFLAVLLFKVIFAL